MRGNRASPIDIFSGSQKHHPQKPGEDLEMEMEMEMEARMGRLCIVGYVSRAAGLVLNSGSETPRAGVKSMLPTQESTILYSTYTEGNNMIKSTLYID